MRSLLSWLLGIDGKTLGPETELSLRWNQSLEGWHVFLLVLGVISFAVWIYRRDGRGTASPLFRGFLGVLRAMVIALAIFILAEPVLLATHIETRRSVALVLVDDSFSMDLAFADAEESLRKKLQGAMKNAQVSLRTPEGKEQKIDAQKIEPHHFKYLTRLDVVSAAMRAGDKGKSFLDTLKEKHDVRLYTFSRTVSANTDDGKPIDVQKLVSSNTRGGETRIGDCLRAALKDMRGQPLAGIVIISDGRQNAGEDAVQAAQTFKTQRVPLFTVGVGDPSEPKDFEVSVEGPEMILPDDQSEVTALVRYKGYTGVTSIKIEMKNGDNVIATEDVKLGKPGEKTPVLLRFKESKPGKYSYSVRIPEQQGELRIENNVATYNFQVVDKKVKVLFVEGQDLPRWEYRYLKNALRRDHTTEVDVLLSTTDGAFLWDGTDGKPALEQFPINKKEISEYDVIIVGDVNPVIFTTEQVNLIRDFVREGGGFIMIAGERFAPAEYSAGVWAEMLPVVPQRTGFQTPDGGFQESFPVELTPEGRKLAWTHLDSDEAQNREVWERLPQLFWFYPVKRKKELATTVAVHPTEKDEQGNKMPIIVTMPYGSGRTMYIGVDSLWRWRRAVGDRYHYRFYNQAIRHLSMAKRLGGQKRFYLGTDRNTVAIGDRVIINAVIKDENHKELTAEKAIVHGKTPKGEDFIVELSRLRDRPGNYEGNFYPAMQGDFSVWIKDDAQPEARQSEVTFKVEKPQLEFENPRLDKELLENLARAGGEGGAFFEIDKLSEVPPRIQPINLEIPRETPFDLWDNWFTFTLFASLITLEWVLRKRGRMI
ncbi:MAG TPA: VWA domain-containing protein [Planctomycetota bacterium]|nr:VWA domain-containing protein [Planctomycetota bacterium]